MASFSGIVTTKCRKEANNIKLPETVCHDARLKTGDHINIQIDDGRIIISKALQCRICLKYVNQLFRKSVLAADDNHYFSLEHCSNCRDIPDYSCKS